ncbi:MAG: hypothetical protein WC702_02295 [Patescibacteria group bacterium]|jgi:hypothetical protein
MPASRSASDLPTAAIEEMVAKRQNFLDGIFTFVPDLIERRGRVVSSEEYTYRYHTKSELLDFGGLSFFFEDGMTGMGGQEVTIHLGNKICLSVYRSGDNKYMVKGFDRSEEWQRALLYVQENENAVAAAWVEVKQQREQAARLAQSEEERRAQAIADARRLGITG